MLFWCWLWLQTLFSRWVQERNTCDLCFQQVRDIDVTARTRQQHLRTNRGARVLIDAEQWEASERHAGSHGRQCQDKALVRRPRGLRLRGSSARTHRAVQGGKPGSESYLTTMWSAWIWSCDAEAQSPCCQRRPPVQTMVFCVITSKRLSALRTRESWTIFPALCCCEVLSVPQMPWNTRTNWRRVSLLPWQPVVPTSPGHWLEALVIFLSVIVPNVTVVDWTTIDRDASKVPGAVCLMFGAVSLGIPRWWSIATGNLLPLSTSNSSMLLKGQWWIHLDSASHTTQSVREFPSIVGVSPGDKLRPSSAISLQRSHLPFYCMTLRSSQNILSRCHGARPAWLVRALGRCRVLTCTPLAVRCRRSVKNFWASCPAFHSQDFGALSGVFSVGKRL